VVPETDMTPDAAAIRADLTYMTMRWGELPEPAQFEIRAFGEGRQTQIGRFQPEWIDDAVEWVTGMNRLGLNCYVVRNPVRANVTKSATDADIIAACFLWADCDDPAAAGNVYRFDGPKWSANVTTGRTPDTRVHVYWELDVPCTDLSAWRQLQSDIAAHFQSDASVINPSRIMRIGGTINWPAAHKRAKGYITEICTVRTEYSPPRSPVSFEQMRRVFPLAGAQAHLGAQSPGGFTIDAGAAPLDRDRTRIQAMAGREWHNAVIRLVASYVSRGLSDAEIHGLTDPLTLAGYTVEQTRREVQVAIDGARRKGWTGAAAEPQKPTTEAIQDFPITSSADFLADLRPLEYLIDGLLPAGVAYSLTGYPGHGKTTLALQFALSVAQGEPFADRMTSKGSVLILAGENPYNVKWQYAAALAARNLAPAEVDIHFVQGRFSIKKWAEVLRAKMAAMPNLKLIIVDSLQAFFEGDNDNDNTQMVEMAHSLRSLSHIEQRPSILIIAHPAGKLPSKENLVPRGGGAFLAEIDGNLTVWSQDAAQQTLHHSQKFRGAGFDPMEWVMQVHEFSHLTDSNGQPLKLPVSRPEMTAERATREEHSDRVLREYLYTVEAGNALSVREAAARFGVSRWRMQQTIETAKTEKLIRRHAKTWVITDGGKDFLEAADAGR
jgi:hypothetical protein